MKPLPPLLTGLGLVAALSLTACGGSPKATTPAKPSPCAAMAANVHAAVIKATADEPQAAALAQKVAAAMEHVLDERCTADAWPAAVIECMTNADVEGIDTCGKQLSEAQQAAVEAQMKNEIEPIMDDAVDAQADKAEPAAESAPPPPPSDPCSGDE